MYILSLKLGDASAMAELDINNRLFNFKLWKYW